MRPRIDAERILGMFEAVAAGAGHMEEYAQKSWVSQLVATAQIRRDRGTRMRTVEDWAQYGSVQIVEKGVDNV